MTALERLKVRIDEGDATDEILAEMLESAKAVIMNTRFPFGVQPAELETRYADLQIRIAEDMYNRIGASGQLQHSENGISRLWGSEWVSKELLGEITPMVGVL